jgi:hypothetical protein
MPWVDCQVVRAGPAENGVVYIALRANDGSFNHWFQANPTMKKEMLATALSAMNADKSVSTLLTGTAAYSEVQRIYAIK